MNEKLLQFIWQFQYYNINALTTVSGESLQVIFPGQLNHNQGPDFLDARIRIGEQTWAGSIELHLATADWIKHGHHVDSNYNNVVLHVVWDATEDRSGLPLLELRSRVSKLLLDRYDELMNLSSFIPCERSIHQVNAVHWYSWKDRLLAERLTRKSKMIGSFLQENNFHWEETCWWLIARNFGITVNADAFEAIARSIPLSVLVKQKKHLIQLEALLLGQAGLLNNRFREDYPRMLQKEYKYQQKKLRLLPVNMPVYFLRMRPGNFPTLRLAQLAMILHDSTQLFSTIRDANEPAEIRKIFDIVSNDYWHYHYRFDEISVFKLKRPGKDMIDNIVINTVCPLLFCYGNYYGEQVLKDKAVCWLEKTSAEANRITGKFSQLGIETKNAFDTQALLELKNEYCDQKRCLECSVGNAILKIPA